MTRPEGPVRPVGDQFILADPGAKRHSRWSFAAKRAMDVAVAVVGLVLLAPVIGVIAVAVRVTMGSPVLFRQVRPGYLARPFEIIKFRSMLPEITTDGRQLAINDRVTKLGFILRKSSLDELPELWNVVKGDMSLVGPRPLIMRYLPRYTPQQARRHEVRPGITGLAQITGRHTLPWDERFRLDVWYVDHWSLRDDLRIGLATIRIALQGSGTLDSEAADFEFMGTEGDGNGDDLTEVGSGPAAD